MLPGVLLWQFELVLVSSEPAASVTFLTMIFPSCVLLRVAVPLQVGRFRSTSFGESLTHPVTASSVTWYVSGTSPVIGVIESWVWPAVNVNEGSPASTPALLPVV